MRQQTLTVTGIAHQLIRRRNWLWRQYMPAASVGVVRSRGKIARAGPVHQLADTSGEVSDLLYDARRGGRDSTSQNLRQNPRHGWSLRRDHSD